MIEDTEMSERMATMFRRMDDEMRQAERDRIQSEIVQLAADMKAAERELPTWGWPRRVV
jgi:flagellar biosynthesis/type III secretory pathway protein FliH